MRSSANKKSGSYIVELFLAEKPKEFVSVDAFAVDELKVLSVLTQQYRPAQLQSGEMFSVGKDILKPKRAGLTDEHFQMLTFLKGIKKLND